MSKHTPKDYATRRFNILAEMLSTQRQHSIKEASERYGVTAKTIRNDLKILDKHLNQPNQKQYIVIGKGYYQGSFPHAVANIDPQVQLYLFLALQHVKPLLTGEGSQAYQLLKDHLYSVLKLDEYDRMEFWSKYYHINSFGNPVNQQHFYQALFHVFEAIRYNQLIKFIYRDYSKPVYFDPYSVYYAKKTFYIIGDKIPSPSLQDKEHRKRRHYRLDRLSQLERLPDHPSKLERNKREIQDFKESHAQNYIQRMIEAEMDGPRENYIFLIRNREVFKRISERIWHPNQKIIEREEGNSVAELHIPKVQSPIELKKWVLGWGAAIKVIEPRSFRQEIIEEVRKMYHDLYK